MSSQPPPQATPKIWFPIFFGISSSVLIYGLLCYLITHNPTAKRHISPNLAELRPFFVALALMSLVAALAWLRFRVDGKIGGEGRPVALSPIQFQTDSIVALALSQACSVYGLALFFLGAPISEFAVFAFGTLFVNFAFILPRGIQFWSTQK